MTTYSKTADRLQNRGRNGIRALMGATLAFGVLAVAMPSGGQALGAVNGLDKVERAWDGGADAAVRKFEPAGPRFRLASGKVGGGSDRATPRPRRSVSSALPPARVSGRRVSVDSKLPPARRVSGRRVSVDSKLPPARRVSGRGASAGSKLPPARGASQRIPTGGTALPPPRRKNERIVVRRPKPGGPICNSKFRNCGGHGRRHGHRHHHHHGHRRGHSHSHGHHHHN